MALELGENDLAKSIQAIIDKEEIRSVIYQFVRGTDRKIRHLVQSVYHPDGVDNHGTYNGPGKDFYDALNSGEPTDSVHHHIGQIVIELGDEGNTANTETYGTATMINRGPDRDNWTTFLVRYVDQFEKRDGTWKIAHRFVVFDGASDRAIMNHLPKENWGTRDEHDFSRKILHD